MEAPLSIAIDTGFELTKFFFLYTLIVWPLAL